MSFTYFFFFFLNIWRYFCPQTLLVERGVSTGAPVQQPEEQMECGAATSDPSDVTTLSQVTKRCDCIGQQPVKDGVRCDAASVFQGAINGEEDLSEEEKARRRAERRKAKRKVSLCSLCPVLVVLQ